MVSHLLFYQVVLIASACRRGRSRRPWKRRAAPGAGGMRGARGGHEQAKRVQAGPATLVWELL